MRPGFFYYYFYLFFIIMITLFLQVLFVWRLGMPGEKRAFKACLLACLIKGWQFLITFHHTAVAS